MSNTKRPILGVSFRGASLAGQGFQNASAGLKLNQKILSAMLSGMGVVLSGIVPVLSGCILELNALASESSLPIQIGILIYVICLIVVIRRGFQIISISFTLGTLILTAISFFILSVNSVTPIVITILSIILSYISIIICSFLLILHAAIVGKRASLIALAGLITFAGFAIPFAIEGPVKKLPGGGIVTTLATFSTIIAILFIVQESLRGASKITWIQEKAVFWAATGGTSFYAADLSDVCFDGANLRHTDLRKANLNRTSFRNVTGLELARLQGTILEDPKVRRLLTTANGQGADLTGANLNGANLQGADLREAILIRTQLLGADLSRAQLTNACIQDWSINHYTKFENIDCQRVYLKCSQHQHFLEPKPDSGEFQPGEFEKWITDVRDTIDLIFQNGLNWRAFAFSLTQTAINHEGLDLSVRSIENKGDGVVVAKIGVATQVNKTTIHEEITEHYQGAVQAIEAQYQLILKAKEGEIDRLVAFTETQQKFIQGLVTGIAETPGKVMIQGEGNRVYVMNQAGDIMENTNQNITAGGNVDLSSGGRVNVGGDVTGSSVTLGDLNGQVSNTIQQLREIQTSDSNDLAKILITLQSAINQEAALSEPQKEQALEAVATIAEEAKKEPEARIPKLCSMAVNALKGITSTVTDASKLAEIFKACLPTLTALLGLH